MSNTKPRSQVESIHFNHDLKFVNVVYKNYDSMLVVRTMRLSMEYALEIKLINLDVLKPLLLKNAV